MSKDGKEKNEWGKYHFNISKAGNLRAFLSVQIEWRQSKFTQLYKESSYFEKENSHSLTPPPELSKTLTLSSSSALFFL